MPILRNIGLKLAQPSHDPLFFTHGFGRRKSGKGRTRNSIKFMKKSSPNIHPLSTTPHSSCMRNHTKELQNFQLPVEEKPRRLQWQDRVKSSRQRLTWSLSLTISCVVRLTLPSQVVLSPGLGDWDLSLPGGTTGERRPGRFLGAAPEEQREGGEKNYRSETTLFFFPAEQPLAAAASCLSVSS